MIVHVLLFATLKEQFGQRSLSVELKEPARVSDLLLKLKQQYPQFDGHSKNLLVSVNKNFAELNQTLNARDEVALFPPVSGG
jgi:molybdopterin converting factor subunit 1